MFYGRSSDVKLYLWLEDPERNILDHRSILPWWKWFCISEAHKRINTFCFKPRTLCWVVTATWGEWGNLERRLGLIVRVHTLLPHTLHHLQDFHASSRQWNCNSVRQGAPPHCFSSCSGDAELTTGLAKWAQSVGSYYVFQNLQRHEISEYCMWLSHKSSPSE